MANEPNKNHAINSIHEDDGVFLKGLIVASEIVERAWEGRSYRQLKITITNGLKSFFYVMNDEAGAFPEVKLFQRARISIENAQSDKGNLTVRGKFAYE